MRLIKVWTERSGGKLRLCWTDPMTKKRVRESTGEPASVSDRRASELAQAKAHELNGDPSLASGGDMTLANWHKRYLRNSRVKETTAFDMQITFKLAERFFGDIALHRLDASRGTDWVTWLREREYRGRKLAAATINKHIRYEKIALERAVVERRLTGLRGNPLEHETCGTIKARKNWHTVTESELEQIMDKCPTVGWRMLFALCRYAGLRQQEAVRLTWEDIEWGGETPHLTIHVQPDARGNAQADTTKDRYRKVLIEPRLMKLLTAAHLSDEPGNGPCNGVPPVPDRVSANAALICKRAGLSYAKPIHTLRKNLETEWFAKYPAPEVAAMLGHSMDVALGHYFKPMLEKASHRETPQHGEATAC